MRNLITAAVVALCITAMAITVQAAQPVRNVSITAAKLVQCISTVIEVQFTPQATGAVGATVSSFDATLDFVLSTGSVSSKSAILTSGTSYTAYVDSGSSALAYIEVRVTANGITSNGVRIWCDGRVEFLGAAGGELQHRCTKHLTTYLWSTAAR